MALQPTLEGLLDSQPNERVRLVFALVELREEWQEAMPGGNLLNIEAPVGLLLNDIANKLQLTPQERYVFLGSRLANAVDDFLETPVAPKLAN